MKTNWQTKPISKYLQNIPKLGSLLSSDYLEDGKFPVIDQGQDFIAGYTNDESLVFKDCLPVIIFGDHTRALKFVDFPFTVGADGTKILKPADDFDPMFFYYMLQSLDLGSRGYARHFKLLKEQEIPLPPLATQHQIVTILDEKFAKLREAKRLRQEATLDTEKILATTLREIFEEGKEKGWREESLGDICEIARGGSPRPIQAYITDDPAGINWIKISDASDSTKYIYTTRQKITKEGLHKTRMVYPGDFILTNSMSFGRPYIMKTEGAIHDGWLLLRPKKELTEEYLYYFLSSDDIYRQFKQLAGGAVVQNLNSQLVKGVKILIPPLTEQQKIVTRLDTLSEKLRTLRELQQSQLEDMKKLEKAYLREAFNGELI